MCISNIKLPCRTNSWHTRTYKDVFNNKKKGDQRSTYNVHRVLLEMLSLLYYFENIKTDFMKIKYKLSVVHITMD